MAKPAKSLVVLIPCLFLFAGTPAYPCGESLFRIGFGLTLPMGRAVHPAKVLIFKGSKGEIDVFFNDAKVSSRLGKTGHRVTLMDGTADIETARGTDFDIVIARDDEMDRAKRALGPRASRAVFVPVHPGFAKANDSNTTLSVNATLRQILGVLEHAMQSTMPSTRVA